MYGSSQLTEKQRALYTHPALLAVFRSNCRGLLCEGSLLFLLAVLELQVGSQPAQTLVMSAARAFDARCHLSDLQLNGFRVMLTRVMLCAAAVDAGQAGTGLGGGRGGPGQGPH